MYAEISVGIEMEKASSPDKKEQISPNSNGSAGEGFGKIDSCFSVRDVEHSLNLWETHTTDSDGNDDISSPCATTETDWTDMGKEHTHCTGLDIDNSTSDALSDEIIAAFDNNKDNTGGHSKSMERNLFDHMAYAIEASKRNGVGDTSIKTYDFGFNDVDSKRTNTSSDDSDSKDYPILRTLLTHKCSNFGSNKSREVFHQKNALSLHAVVDVSKDLDSLKSSNFDTAQKDTGSIAETSADRPQQKATARTKPKGKKKPFRVIVDVSKDFDSLNSSNFDTAQKDTGSIAETSADRPQQKATARTKPKGKKKPFRVKSAIVKEVYIEECDSGDETIQSDPWVANRISAILRSAEEPKLVAITGTIPHFPDTLTADKLTCSECYEQFEVSERMQAAAHMMIHFPQARWIFTCWICSMMFQSRSQYNEHERVRHPDWLARKCDQAECKSDMKFYSVVGYKTHMKYQHFAHWKGAVRERSMFTVGGVVVVWQNL